MFILIPWKVDVPQDRWPMMNWLIIAALIVVYALQVADAIEYAANHDLRRHSVQQRNAATQQEQSGEEPQTAPGITGKLILRGWSLKGLFGHMWLHGGLFHLAGNLLFLWIFGNAVCAKLGNLRYLALYVLCGVTAGAVQLLFVSNPVLGASGAINGVVGMYLVLFYENEISCLFIWLFPPVVRTFDVSSFWMILFWLFWDVVGALRGGSGVAYFAHLGGFATGFGMAMLLCRKGWVTMERYEKSLLHAWRERRGMNKPKMPDPAYAAIAGATTFPPEPALPPTAELKPIPLPELAPADSRHVPLTTASIRTVCACGREVTVSRQYAGRTIRCFACDQPLVIPQTSDFFGPTPQPPKTAPRSPTRNHDRCIRFACSCGRKIKAPVQYAGRMGKCPQCGLRLRIPSASL